MACAVCPEPPAPPPAPPGNPGKYFLGNILIINKIHKNVGIKIEDYPGYIFCGKCRGILDSLFLPVRPRNSDRPAGAPNGSNHQTVSVFVKYGFAGRAGPRYPRTPGEPIFIENSGARGPNPGSGVSAFSVTRPTEK